MDLKYRCRGSQQPPRRITLIPDPPRHQGRGQCEHCATDFKLRWDGTVRAHR